MGKKSLHAGPSGSYDTLKDTLITQMSCLQTETNHVGTGSGVQCCLLTPYHISSESPTINPHPLILLPGLGPRKLSSSPRLAHFVIIEINSSLGVSEWVGGG